MYYTLDRTENGTVAVLIDSNGKKHDVDIQFLKPEAKTGYAYTFDGIYYI